VFLEAARRLDLPAADCLVFEDAPMGVEAGKAAGMVVAALTTSFSQDHFQSLTVPPDLVCADFDAFLRMSLG
jgi:beta-phosphoglucomutase-like phosphatase (HAD superfamily)